MEHFLKENAAFYNFLHCLFSRTTKTFIAFLISYKTLKYTNMKGVKRKAERPTLAVFGSTKKFIMERSSHSYLNPSFFLLVYQMCRVAIMLNF